MLFVSIIITWVHVKVNMGTCTKTNKKHGYMLKYRHNKTTETKEVHKMYTMSFEDAYGIITDAMNDGMTIDEAINGLADVYLLFDDEVDFLYDYFCKINPLTSL